MSKKLLISLMAMGLIGAAQATPTALGPVGLSGVSVDSIELPWSGGFTNDFTFSLAQGNSLQVGMTTSYWGSLPEDVPGITFEILSLGSYLPTISVTNDVFSAGGVLAGLDQGVDYTLRISGSDSWNLGTEYFLQVAASNAVSEPDSYALLLGSLGLMALVARRRQGKNGVSA